MSDWAMATMSPPLPPRLSHPPTRDCEGPGGGLGESEPEGIA